MADNSQRIQNILGQLDESVEELKELQSSYIEQKKSIVSRMESVISKLARLADTQAVKATVLRQLYWDYNIPAKLLADALPFCLIIGGVSIL